MSNPTSTRRKSLVYEYLRSFTVAFSHRDAQVTHFIEYNPKGANHSDSERGRLIMITCCEGTTAEEAIAHVARIENEFTTDYRWLKMQ